MKRSHALNTIEQPTINKISVKKSERFLFPGQDIAPKNTYKDNRTEIEIFQDILKILGRKIKACDITLYE